MGVRRQLLRKEAKAWGGSPIPHAFHLEKESALAHASPYGRRMRRRLSLMPPLMVGGCGVASLIPPLMVRGGVTK